MTADRFSRRLLRNCEAATTIELAILAPAFLTLLFAVFQVGMAMQNYTALRGISADVSRYALVQYSTGNKLSIEQLRSHALAVGRSAPYMLDSDMFNASVKKPVNQRVIAATEFELTLSYQVFSVMSSYGLTGPYITFARPIFVTSK